MPEQKEESEREVKRYVGETFKATTEIHFVQRKDMQHLIFVGIKKIFTFLFK